MEKRLGVVSLQNFIINKRKRIFSPLDLQRYFGASYETARKFIQRNIKKGIYIKIKKGLCFDKNFPPSEIEIANKLYYPSYVSFEYALSYYGIISETVYSITSATSKRAQEFFYQKQSYFFHHIKKQAFTGYCRKNIDGQFVYLAVAEKAFVDYLYFVDLGRKALYDRIDVSQLSYKMIKKFADLFDRKSLLKLTKKIYDHSGRDKKIIY